MSGKGLIAAFLEKTMTSSLISKVKSQGKYIKTFLQTKEDHAPFTGIPRIFRFLFTDCPLIIKIKYVNKQDDNSKKETAHISRHVFPGIQHLAGYTIPVFMTRHPAIMSQVCC